MKTVKIDLPDDEAVALARAAVEWGFASPSELARAAIEDFLAGTPAHGPEGIESDIAEYEAEKARGEPTLTPEEARHRLREAAAKLR